MAVYQYVWILRSIFSPTTLICTLEAVGIEKMLLIAHAAEKYKVSLLAA